MHIDNVIMQELNKPSSKEFHFKFTQVLDQDVLQQSVFDTSALRLVDDLIQGKNGMN